MTLVRASSESDDSWKGVMLSNKYPTRARPITSGRCEEQECVRNTRWHASYKFLTSHLCSFFFSDSLNGNLIKPEEAKVFEDEKRIVCF